LQIEITKHLDWNSIKKEYQKDQRVRIEHVWPNEVATSIGACLQNETNFSHAYHLKGRSVESSEQEIAAMSQRQQQELTANLFSDAAQGVGFLYGRHMIQQNSPALLQKVKSYFNSTSLLDKIRYITDRKEIKLASAQGTRYIKGNFLTRHNDVFESEGRIIAYVLAFTPNWHPDCGGLLQFYQDDGSPRDAWSPIFNSLTLFDVEHVHSVTYLPPFAPAQRLSITGWFRSQ